MMQQLDLFSSSEPPPQPAPEVAAEQVPAPLPPPPPLQAPPPPAPVVPVVVEEQRVKIQIQLPSDMLPAVAVRGTAVTASQPPKKRGRKSLKEVADDPDLIKTLDAVT